MSSILEQCCALVVYFIGLRSANDLTLPAYLTSRESCRRLASTILPSPSEPTFENVDDIITTWASFGSKIHGDPVRQSNFDSMLRD